MKIAYLIVNKDASLKAITKEIFKLKTIVGNNRLAKLTENYDRLVADCISGKSDPRGNMTDAYAQDELTQRYEDWTQTPSHESRGFDGVLRDECALAWPIAYYELSEEDFRSKIEEVKKIDKDLVTYNNVALTLPVNLRGNTDARLSEILN